MIASSKRIDSLQVMRALAAISVMAFHGTHMLLAQLHFKFFNSFFFAGFSGVDIFFVISGFIILHTSDQKKFNVINFLKKRFIRIYPIYWVVTLLLIAAHFVAPFPDQAYKSSPSVIAGSLTLIPSGNYVLGVAWSLTFEILFYIVFAVAFAKSVKCLFITLLSWSVIILVLYVLHIPYYNSFVDTLTNPIIIEFAAGCLLAYLYGRYPLFNYWRWFVLAGGVLFLGAWLMYNHAVFQKPTAFSSYISRVYLFGLPATILIFGLLYFRKAIPGVLVYIGNASYSLYLIHGTVISILLKLIFKFKLESYFANNLGGICVFATTILVGCLFYKFIETPLLKLLNSFLKTGRSRLWYKNPDPVSGSPVTVKS